MGRFWHTVAVFLLGAILGTGFGLALGFFFFPYVFPPPPATEELTEADRAPPVAVAPPVQVPSAPSAGGAPPAAATSVPPASLPAPATSDAPARAAPAGPVATGTFIHANPSDPVHWGRGKVSVYAKTVFLEPDFEVGPGPAYHVYLVPRANIRQSSHLNNEMFVDLGRLRSFKGSQRYPVPDGVDLAKYPSVIIWCERFSVLISPADLKAP
jgi:hypothetical protein